MPTPTTDRMSGSTEEHKDTSAASEEGCRNMESSALLPMRNDRDEIMASLMEESRLMEQGNECHSLDRLESGADVADGTTDPYPYNWFPTFTYAINTFSSYSH